MSVFRLVVVSIPKPILSLSLSLSIPLSHEKHHSVMQEMDDSLCPGNVCVCMHFEWT